MMKPRGPSVTSRQKTYAAISSTVPGELRCSAVSVNRYRLRKDGDPGAGELSNLGRRDEDQLRADRVEQRVRCVENRHRGLPLCAAAPGRPSLFRGIAGNPSGNDDTSSVASALLQIERGVSMSAVAVRTPLPLILIRGFGGLGVEDEKKVPYQGFNDGTVYPRKRGANYIYEGMILRFMKSHWQFQDATNVIGYYGKPVVEASEIPPELEHFDKTFFSGSAQSGRGRRFEVQDRRRPGDGAAPAAHDRGSAADAVGLPLLRPRRAQFSVLRAGSRAPDRLHPCARGGEGRRRAADGEHHCALDGRADRPRGDTARVSRAGRNGLPTTSTRL